MSYDINSTLSNCYEGTTCLINKFNIKDETVLAEIEAKITFAKASELEENPIKGNFDFDHYKSIHRFLFEDIYDWAGQIRTINISKMGTKFVNACDIESLALNCFNRLKQEEYFKNYSFEVFIKNIVDLYCVTNSLHPFREGNGRTQRLFIQQLIRYNGYDIDFSQIDKDELMIATIQSSNGVFDNLIKIFRNSIK